MFLVVTGEVAAAARGSGVPGALAVAPVQEGHGSGVEVDEMRLLAAVCIVAGVTGGSLACM